MAEQLQYNEAMGSMPEHLNILKTRVDAARENLERAQGKPEALRSTAVANAQRELDSALSDQEAFLAGNMPRTQGDSTETVN